MFLGIALFIKWVYSVFWSFPIYGNRNYLYAIKIVWSTYCTVAHRMLSIALFFECIHTVGIQQHIKAM
jgi:hypothetical protein